MSGAAATDERPLVSILVPAYNEAALVEASLARICESMEGLALRYRWELVVVDDGSRDGTGDLARAFAATRSNVRVCSHLLNFGLGRALSTGFGECRGDYIVVLDLDLSYAPSHVEALLERMRSTRAEIVVASPYTQGGRTSEVPFLRRLLSRWGNRFLALTARGVNRSGDLSTLTGMVRAYDARFVRSLNLKLMGPEINTEILYKAMILGARIEEIPAHLDWSAQRGTARVSRTRIRRGILVSLLAGFMIRPFVFFIVPAALLALVSLYPVYWIFYHVVTHYAEVAPAQPSIGFAFSEAVARAFETSPHAFIVGGLTLVLSVQLFSLGVLALQMKQYFEELFHFQTRIYARSLERERFPGERQADGEPTASGPGSRE